MPDLPTPSLPGPGFIKVAVAPGDIKGHVFSSNSKAMPADTIQARPVWLPPGAIVIVVGKDIDLDPTLLCATPTPPPMNGQYEPEGPILSKSKNPAAIADTEDKVTTVDCRLPGARKFASPANSNFGRYSNSNS